MVQIWGAEDEAELGQPTVSSSPSSRDTPAVSAAEEAPPQPVSTDEELYPPKEQHMQEAVEGEVPPLSVARHVSTRTSHTRQRRTTVEEGEGTERRSDSTRFDVGTVLRTLKRFVDKITIERDLRKLHLRW